MINKKINKNINKMINKNINKMTKKMINKIINIMINKIKIIRKIEINKYINGKKKEQFNFNYTSISINGCSNWY